MIFCPASRGASLLCPQKQCLSGKLTDFQDAQTKGSLYTREAHYRPIVPRKVVTHYTLPARRVKKDREISHSLSFFVGANCVRPRAFTERPYEDDFLSVGITCFMVGAPCGWFFVGNPKQKPHFFRKMWDCVG